jgi:hypothetical protein
VRLKQQLDSLFVRAPSLRPLPRFTPRRFPLRSPLNILQFSLPCSSDDSKQSFCIFCKFGFPRVDNWHSSWNWRCLYRPSFEKLSTSTDYLWMKCLRRRLARYTDNRLLSITCIRMAATITKLDVLPCPTVGSLDSKRRHQTNLDTLRRLSPPNMLSQAVRNAQARTP